MATESGNSELDSESIDRIDVRDETNVFSKAKGAQRCAFCQETQQYALELHHIIPQRYGGPDEARNLVTVCSNCHKVLEALYNNQFFQAMGVERKDDVNPRHYYHVRWNNSLRSSVVQRKWLC